MQAQRWFSRLGYQPIVLTGCMLLAGLGSASAADGIASRRIVLKPEAGAMQVRARVPALGNQAFALGLPETIGCREALLVNFPEARVEWQGPDADGVVACSWGPGGRISYDLRLAPAEDFVDVEMTVRNHTEFLWRDVFAFNCLNPIEAPTFQDWKLDRTYMSRQGQPFRMSGTTRVQGHMPTVGCHDPTHPLYAIYGQDPRTTASQELGDKLVAEIVSRLADQVNAALAAAQDLPR